MFLAKVFAGSTCRFCPATSSYYRKDPFSVRILYVVDIREFVVRQIPINFSAWCEFCTIFVIFYNIACFIINYYPFHKNVIIKQRLRLVC